MELTMRCQLRAFPRLRASLTVINLVLTGLLCAISYILVGCSSNLPDGFGSKRISWSVAQPGHEPLSGVDYACVDFGVWGDGAAVVVWSDSRSTSFSGAGMGERELQPGETGKGVKYEGIFHAQDGHRVDVECYTADAVTGTVRIGGGTYELARGALFLVSFRNGRERVRQFSLQKLGLKPLGSLAVDTMTQEMLIERARTDLDIQTFFHPSFSGD